MFKLLAVCLLLMIALNGNNIAIAAGESDPQFSQYNIALNPAGELREHVIVCSDKCAQKNITEAVLASQPFGEVPLDGYKSTDLIYFDIEIIWSKLLEHQHQNVYVYLAHQE
ncbi:MAG: hypothetical protein P4L53_22675 [Candidatus Obscuribacterales bacterium]|nr:hypothetical protein [Candidatus Obscuribacterales bacterium]